jgi:hypothetical protein
MKRQTVFISWKHSDLKGRKRDNFRRRNFVKEFVRELNKNKIAVWIDELALPNYQPKTADDNLLELLLKQGLQQSRVVIAVASGQYGCISPKSTKNWTKQEWQSKLKRNRLALFTSGIPQKIFEIEGNRQSVILESEFKRLYGKPSDAARKFLEWYM